MLLPANLSLLTLYLLVTYAVLRWCGLVLILPIVVTVATEAATSTHRALHVKIGKFKVTYSFGVTTYPKGDE